MLNPLPAKTSHQRDVIILGAGPSGLSTALHLVQRAPEFANRILILDKAHHPRAKLCAGGLTLDAEKILERLHLNTDEVPHVDAHKVNFGFGRRGRGLGLPNRHAIRVIRRNEFDAWLAGKAREQRIEIRESVTVKNVVPNQDGVIVETDAGTFRAKVVVGADGSNGPTRRAVLPSAPVHTARVLEVIAPYEKSVQDQGVAYFDFLPVPKNIAGYVWDFPTQINGQPMRCWGIYDTNLLSDNPRPALKEFLEKEMARHGLDLKRLDLQGFPIRWFDPRGPLSGSGVLLVGDAAGADPLFGEGISIALGYGAVAARAITDAFTRDDFSFRRYRRRVLTSPLGQTLIARWMLAHFIYSLNWNWFQTFLWGIFKPIAVVVGWLFVLNWGKRLKV